MQILGVPRDATDVQIKRAFRKLSKKYHPDLNGGSAEAQKKFMELNEAGEILSDKEKRQVYDLDGMEGLERMKQGGGRGMHPFAQFFGGGGPGGRPKGPNAVVELRMSLEQLYSGAETTLHIERYVLDYIFISYLIL